MLARAMGDGRAGGRSLLQAGSMYMMTGCQVEAASAFAAAREAFVAERSAPDIASADANLANLEYGSGRFPEAAALFERSYAGFEALKDEAGMASSLHGLGNALYMQTEFGRALECYTKALAVAERMKDTYRQSAIHRAIAMVDKEQGDYGPAIGEWRKSLALSQSGGDVAGAHFVLGQFDAALTEYEQSLVLREKQDDRPGVMWTLVHMGILHASQKRAEQAAASYARALGIAETAGDLNAPSTVHALRGRLELDREQAEAALASTSRAIEISTSLERFDAVSFAEVVAGRAHQKAGRLPEAREAFERAVAALARVPIGPAADVFFDDRRTACAALVDLLAGQGDTAEAFRWSERGRQRELADLLGGEPARKTPDTARIADLHTALAGRRTDREALRQKIFAAHPALQVLRAQGEAAGPDAAAAIAVKAADLARQARAFREAIALKDDKAGDIARALHALLVEPVAGVLTKKARVIVIPDGCLWGLPFEALLDSHGRFLVEDSAVSHASSLTALVAMETATTDGAARPRLSRLRARSRRSPRCSGPRGPACSPATRRRPRRWPWASRPARCSTSESRPC